jgi:hypothetical protein
MDEIREDFRGELHPPLTTLEQGTGRITFTDDPAGVIRLSGQSNQGEQYSNAQIDDYLARQRFVWRPPLRMTVRAWASHGADELKGTAGFGFWTQPILPGKKLPILPASVWFFFGSPPSDMPFDRHAPGYGWKAAVFDSTRLPFLLLAPTAPLGVLLMRVPTLYRLLWPVGQWAIGVSEKSLEVDIRDPHTYRLDWLAHSASFYVDDRLVHKTPYAPRGPLGFVSWLDNRWAVITPQGRVGFGTLRRDDEQWLALDYLHIEPITQ